MSTRFSKNSWKEFTDADLKVIEEERAVSKTNPVQIIEGKQYGIVCRACTKPNTLSVDFCTGCGFPATREDIIQLPDNVFLDMINGKNTGTKILYRDNDFLVFDDKFGVSDNHLDIIPTQVIPDITELDASHIPMLEKLYQLGIEEFERRNLPTEQFGTVDQYHSLATSGYNYPVSVKHLHLHMVLPPFKHRKVFQYPRWHSHKKVISDLKLYGKVRTYDKEPNDSEGAAEYQRAIDNHDTMEMKKSQFGKL